MTAEGSKGKRLMLLDEDTRMIQETVAKFVDREMIPIEERGAEGEGQRRARATA